MAECVSAEWEGTVFHFEPPVSVRDDEYAPISLQRLTVIAALGIASPRRGLDDVCEIAFSSEIRRAGSSARAAEYISALLDGKYTVTIS